MSHVIKQNLKKIRESIPDNVKLVAAGKARKMEEIAEALEADIQIIGHNYIQEAVETRYRFGADLNLHFIGHLQKNKINKAIETCNLIQTVDSLKLAQDIDKRCEPLKRVMPVFIEINSGEEPQKQGVLPDETPALIQQIALLKHIQIKGLMTMGPFKQNPEEVRPYFKTTKQLFDQLVSMKISNVKMDILSMGMSDSYPIAIEEGANMIRIGSAIFGPR